jgi:hypothetical protein
MFMYIYIYIIKWTCNHADVILCDYVRITINEMLIDVGVWIVP